MKKTIFIVIAILVLVGGAISVFVFLNKEEPLSLHHLKTECIMTKKFRSNPILKNT